MKRSLVIEGPDGAGKSTLIRTLRAAYPQLPEPTRAATSTGGPLPNMDVWIDLDYVDRSIGACKLYDRHPLISGPIYDRAAGIPQSFETSGESYDRHLRHLFDTSLVVVCLPEIDTVVENIKREPQLVGVRENIRDLWSAYYAELDKGCLWYDYEEPEDLYYLCLHLEGDVL